MPENEHEDEEVGTEEEHDDEESQEDEPSGSGGESPGTDHEALRQMLTEVMTESVEPVIDRRINSLMKTLRSDYGLKKRKDDDGDDDGKPAGGNRHDRRRLRDLRSAVREEAAARFDDPKERKVAFGLAWAVAEARGVSDDEYEDDVASDVFDMLEESLTDVRDTYQGALREDLKRRGLLKDDDKPGQPGKGGDKKDTPSPTKQFEAGRQKALSMFGQKED